MSNKFVVSLLALLLPLAASGHQFRSDYKFFDQVGGWMKYHFVPVTWNDARLRCHVEGGVLASPLKEEMASLMIDKMKEEQVETVFTGIHSTYSKGVFVAIEGIRLEDLPISRGKVEIDNKNNKEDCLVMNTSGLLADVECQNVNPYFCFKKFDSSLPEPNVCGTTDGEYHLSPVTGHCYKFHSYGQPWDRAYMTCAAEGGYLAIINSEREAGLLRDLFVKHPVSTIISRSKDWAHIGYKAEHENNFWITIEGQSLKEAGYAVWRAGEPNNASAPMLEYGQHCGNMHRSGQLDDNHCLGTSPFICEKHPNTLQ